MTYPAGQWLVETEWLASHLDAPDIVVFDASWQLPDSGRNARQEYLAGHIPGALFFDIDEISDTESPYPHMLPSPEKFSSRMRKMGVGDGMRIVVYDSAGLFSAARVWWMFRVMGVREVAVLNGGLPKWKAEHRPVEDLTPPLRTERHFTARRNAEQIRDRDDVAAATRSGSAQVVDARSADRFGGKVPEPRPGVRSGHIPGSLNVPYTSLLNKDGTVKASAELEKIFADAGVDASRPIITTCGSGVTAAVPLLGLALLGHWRVSLYDGSWSEWGSDADLPAEVEA